ncbi:hypothetical protein PC118_g21462 [Phytophthora cactorum]|uniref:Uncharacterized protein n=1 Tax=Phytophthora cactorum TaxID=29920 RepID=A0A8T1F2M6_9STRA|nr:hypothetical protein PC111_g24794 [Phytophthora cactorum]KAG2962361.1 hypothetical protein PC118_g21462 [Phytophthora cactorum]KAG3045934.1 hypothetical protein PC121_g20973 [Phytophthora cactorum]
MVSYYPQGGRKTVEWEDEHANWFISVLGHLPARLHSSGGPTRRVKAPTLPRHRWLRNDEAALEVMKMKT